MINDIRHHWAVKILSIGTAGAVSLLFLTIIAGCSQTKEAAEAADVYPKIFPDYIGVTVPVNIAPLNFMIDGVDDIQARFTLDGKEMMSVTGRDGIVDIPEDEWHDMTAAAVGKKISVEVSAWNDQHPDGIRYKPFDIHVSGDKIEAWIAYRLIEPGYEAWRQVGIYERELSSFNEVELVSNKGTHSACINCHHFDRYSSKRMMFHARGENGGTIFLEQGKTRKVNPEKTGPMKGVVYPAWHPDGRYIAFSSNMTRQAFFGQGRQPLEVFDKSSDLVLYDTKEERVITDPRFLTEETMETFPAWSPDGKWLYYCAAASKKLPAKCKDVHYNILRVAFDSKECKFGERIDTVYNAMTQGGSASFPRISPDGHYLLYTLADFGTFPIWHPEADLKMTDLLSGEPVDVSALNSPDNTESYHSWSSNGRWIMFASRRLDGRYTRVFMAYFDKNGKVGKPFLLPQKNPQHNTWRLKSYNIPEFVDGKVEMPEETVELFRCKDKVIQ